MVVGKVNIYGRWYDKYLWSLVRGIFMFRRSELLILPWKTPKLPHGLKKVELKTNELWHNWLFKHGNY